MIESPGVSVETTAGGVPRAAVETRLRVTVSRIENAAKGCRIIELRPAEGRRLPPAAAGAHIGLHLPNGVQRQYSLLTDEAEPQAYRVGVKRDPQSRGGSAYVFDRLSVGDLIEIDPPRNNFPLDETAPHSVFIAGGIGITPIRSMIRRLEALGRSWSLYYAARARDEALFAEELGLLGPTLLHFDEEQDAALLPIERIVREAPAGAHLYCCGPAPMLTAFEAATESVPAERVHVEYFTKKHEASTEGEFVVELAKAGFEVRVPAGHSILDVVRNAGLDVSFSCEEGICGACETRVLAGEPDHRDAILSQKERAANDTMFICCSGSKGDRLVLDL